MAVILSLGPFSGAGAADAMPTLVRAELDVASARTSGALIAAVEGPAALLFDGFEDENLSLSWRLDAPELSLRWERSERVGLGDSAGNPNASYVSHELQSTNGTWTLHDAHLRLSVDEVQANAFVRTLHAANATLTTDEPATILPSAGMPWAAGDVVNSTAPPAKAKRFTEIYNTTLGDPLLASTRTRLSVDGAFGLFSWGGEILVQSREYQGSWKTGVWWENATAPVFAPKGVARTQYQQSALLQTEQGTLVLEVGKGRSWLTAPRSQVDLNGTVAFEGAKGTLATTERLVTVANETIRLEGRFTGNLSAPGDDPARLRAQLQPPPTDGAARAAPPASMPPASVLDYGQGNGGLWKGATGFATGLLLLSGVVLLVRFLQARQDPFGTAEKCLRRGRPLQSAWWASQGLKSSPDSKEGWFLYGAACLQGRREDTLVRRLSGAGRIAREPEIAFLLSLAHARRDRVGEALRWAELAASDPVLRRRLESEAAFLRLRSGPEWNRVMEPHGGPAGYA